MSKTPFNIPIIAKGKKKSQRELNTPVLFYVLQSKSFVYKKRILFNELNPGN